ncbi:hypothetical protein GCM10023063_49980 [Arthrobacter methylotrophus]|uniref:hypothetical protein n=1 Tax=Arthrobacter methylotrophus TaxID=121291 RepID=UPI0031E6DCB8
MRVPAGALAYVPASGVFVATDKGFRFQEVAVASTDDAVAVVRANLPTGTRVAVAGVGALKACWRENNDAVPPD